MADDERWLTYCVDALVAALAASGYCRRGSTTVFCTVYRPHTPITNFSVPNPNRITTYSPLNFLFLFWYPFQKQYIGVEYAR